MAVSSLQALVGIQRRQVVEEDLVAGFLRRLEVDGVHFDEREVALAFLGRTDLSGDGIAGAQIEAADLRRRDVDVVGSGQVIVLGRAQESESIGQAFEHAFREDEAALFGLRLEDLEDQLLLAQPGGAGDAQILGNLVELLDTHILELDQIERAVLLALAGNAAAMLAVSSLSGRALIRRLGVGQLGVTGRFASSGLPLADGSASWPSGVEVAGVLVSGLSSVGAATAAGSGFSISLAKFPSLPGM